MENKKNIYNESIEELYSRFQTNEYGLNDSDAQKRKLRHEDNFVKRKKTFFLQVTDSINIILLLITFLTAMISYINDETYIAPVIMFIIAFTNLIMNYYYEKNDGKKKIDNIVNSKYNVYRYGIKKAINIDDIVPGDIVELNENDNILFDGRIISCENFEVDELIANKSKISIKNNNIINDEKNTDIDEISNMVFSSSKVVKGKANILVTNTDFTNILQGINYQLGVNTKKTSIFHVKLNKTVNNLTLVAYAIIVLLFIMNVINKGNLLDVVDLSLLLIIGAIPIGLQIILTTILLYKKKIIEKNGFTIRKTSSIIDLANINTICFTQVDKNTINYCNDMGIRCIIISDQSKEKLQELNIDGIDNNQILDKSEIDKMNDDEIINAVKTYQLYSDLDYSSKRRIVQALQSNKKVVATVGNSIYDIPVIYESNVGLATKENKITQEISEFVIDNDLFSTIKLLKECNKVNLIINKVLSYLVSESLLSIIILFISLILDIRIINAMQLLWLKIMNILLSIMMMYDDENIFSNRLNNFKRKLILRNSIIIGIVMVLLYIYNVSKLDMSSASSLLFISLIVNSLLSTIYFLGKKIFTIKKMIIFFSIIVILNIIMLMTKLSTLFIVKDFGIKSILLCVISCFIAFTINKLIEIYYKRRKLKYEE